MTNPSRVATAYDGSNSTFRLFRAGGGCELLMNLGWFPYPGPLSFLNLVADMAQAEIRLVTKSAALLNVQAGDAVLDVACGRGKSSYMIAQLYPRCTVTGVDLLPENIQVARTLYGNSPRLSYVVGDAMDLGLADHSFDRVHCLEAAFHFPDRARFLREAYRLLRDGGSLVVVDFAWKTSEGHRIRDEDPAKRVRQVWQWDDFSSIEEYRQAALDAGFELWSCHDWTRHVSKPITLRFSVAAWLGQRKWGRRLLAWLYPLSWGTSDGDWREIEISAQASRRFSRHYVYIGGVKELAAFKA
jgi:tocopherol O-methyltransferase